MTAKTRCRSGCLTGGHSSWGECARAADLRIGYANSANGLDLTAQKRWDAELNAYRAAKAAGVQPDSTRAAAVQRAMDVSEKTGVAYGAGV